MVQEFQVGPSSPSPSTSIRFPLECGLCCSVCTLFVCALTLAVQIILLSTPVLVPLLLSLIITRLALASRASRARIKLLEKEQSSQERLVHVVGRLEREMEDAMVDMFDSPGLSDAESSQPSLPTSPAQADLDAASKRQAKQKQDLVLSDVQKKIVAWLNALPGLKKELAFIHPVRNAHAVIISRDVKRFPSHKQGEGVIRHWADHFIM